MPYFWDPNLKKQDDEAEQNQFKISGASPTTDQMGTPDQGQGVGQEQPNKGLRTGSGFQNLDKYLQANSGRQFGNEFINKVGNEQNQAQAGMDNASSQFKQKVGDISKTPSQQQIDEAILNPEKADAKQYQDWTKNTYQGPKSLGESQGDWSQYWSGVNKAQTNANQLGKESGRFALLDQYYGRPHYTSGEKSLDNALVQNEAGNRLNSLREGAAVLKSSAKQGEQGLQDYAAKAIGSVDTSRKAARSAIGIDDQDKVIEGEGAGALGKYYADLNKQLSDAQAGRTANQKQISDNLKNREFTDAELANLGLNEGDSLYNIDIDPYLQLGPGQVGKGQILDEKERARLQALNDLAGTQNQWAGVKPEELGSDYSFNKDEFRKRQGEVKNAFDVENNGHGGQISWEMSGPRADGVFQAHPILFAGVPGEGAPLEAWAKWADNRRPWWEKAASQPNTVFKNGSLQPSPEKMWASEMLSKFKPIGEKWQALNSSFGLDNKVKRRA